MEPMRTKLLWITVVILGVVLTASRAQSPAPHQPSMPASGDVGRYLLYAGPSASNMADGNYLYRIDTRTGRTWWYSQINGAGHGGWVEISDFVPVKPPQ